MSEEIKQTITLELTPEDVGGIYHTCVMLLVTIKVRSLYPFERYPFKMLHAVRKQSSELARAGRTVAENVAHPDVLDRAEEASLEFGVEKSEEQGSNQVVEKCRICGCEWICPDCDGRNA